jgi:hypothetical protein
VIAEHGGLDALTPGDEPVRGARPIAVALNVRISGPYMKQAAAVRAEGRIAFPHGLIRDIKAPHDFGSRRCA